MPVVSGEFWLPGEVGTGPLPARLLLRVVSTDSTAHLDGGGVVAGVGAHDVDLETGELSVTLDAPADTIWEGSWTAQPRGDGLALSATRRATRHKSQQSSARRAGGFY